jgi:radical SAM-linked protein
VRGDRGTAVRVRWSKHGPVRFTSHRDMARSFERAFRICQLPLGFSEGFTPHPKVSFGLALSVGYESDAEYLDIELTVDDLEAPALDELGRALAVALPEGVDVTGVTLLEPRAQALQDAVSEVDWRIEVVPDLLGAELAGSPLPAVDPDRFVADVHAAATAITTADRLEATRKRKGKDVTDDVRPAIRELAVTGPTERGALLELALATRPVSLRPREVVALLGPTLVAAGGGSLPPLVEGRVHRTHQWIERDGARREPLDADTRPCALGARAS